MKKHLTRIKKWLKRRSWLILIVLLGFVTIAFLSGETNLNPFGWTKINADKVAAYATTISSLLTAITVFLLYRQMGEQIKENRESIEPELYPSQCSFTVVQELDRFTGDIQRPSFRQYDKKLQKQIHPKVAIHNIGLGPAKEVNMKWEYDKESIKFFTEDRFEIISPELESAYLDFVLLDQKDWVNLPLTYLYVFAPETVRNRTQKQFLNMPKLYLLIHYKGRDGRAHLKRFIVRADISSLIGNDSYISVKFTFRDDSTAYA